MTNKAMKCGLMTIAAVLLVVMAFAGAASAAVQGNWTDVADTNWYGDGSSDVFTLTTPEELAGLAVLVNAGIDNFSGKMVILGNDIDLGGKNWTPIGNDTRFKNPKDNPYLFFAGTFDGKNHTISNIIIDVDRIYNSTVKDPIFDKPYQFNYLGFFGMTNGITIKNLYLNSVDINAKVEADNANPGRYFGVGALIGADRNSFIMKNCHVSNAKIRLTIPDAGSKQYSYLGGIIGGTSGSSITIENCDVDASISVSEAGYFYAGLICNTFVGTITNVTVNGSIKVDRVNNYGFVGGAVGIVDSTSGISNISNASITCVLKGNATGNTLDMGNVIGRIGSNNNPAQVNICNCYAYGDMHSAYIGGNPGNPKSGGIVAAIYKGTDITISDSYATGSIIIDISSNYNDCTGYVGGILGYSGQPVTISNCTAACSQLIINKHRDAQSASFGRIIGNDAGTISNCYAWEGMKVNGDFVSTDDVKNGSAVSSEILWNNQSFFKNTLGWNFDNVWKMNDGNDNYKLPVLKWQTTPVSGDASYLKPVTVTFDSQGGSSVAEQKITNGFNATRPAENPIKAGYTFENWYNESECTGVFDFSAKLTADTKAYANWTVNTTEVTASGYKAEFGNDNVTAIHSPEDNVVQVLLVDISSVTDTPVKFTADNTSVDEIPNVAGYNKDEIAAFELNAAALGTAKINITVTFANESTATAKKDNVSFYHYNTTNNAWDTQPLTIASMVQTDEKVLYTVETTSFSPFGIGIFTPITYTVHFDANGGVGSMADMDFTYDEGQNLTANAFQRYNSNFLYWTYNGTRYYNTDFVKNLTVNQSEIVVMKAEWEVYSTGGSSSGSTYMGSNSASYTPTQQPTVKPTVAPTAAPTEKPATPTVIATAKPTTQATQQSPAPFVGLLAGLGVAAVLLRLRK